MSGLPVSFTSDIADDGATNTIARLDVGPVGFEKAHFEAAESAVREHGLWDSCHGAVMAGSLSVGLGTSTSDVDVYVFVDEVSKGRSHPVRDGIRVDVEQIAVGEIRELSEKFRAFTSIGEERSQTHMDESALKLAVRTHLGAVLKPDAFVQEVRQNLDPLVLRQVLMARSMALLGAYVEDVLGAIEVRDLPTAVCASGIALDMAADALLAACGDVYVSDKLRLRRLVREPRLRGFARTYWDLQYNGLPPDMDPDRIARTVHSRLWLINAIGCACFLEFWEREPAENITFSGVEGHGPVRSPFHVPVRYADGCGLTIRNSAFDVSEDALRLWFLLDGRSPDAVVKEFARAVGSPVDEETSRQILDAIDQFDGQGLIHH
ncbi:hypothetical protein [Streptomyces mutomycini]|uniref:Polymerase nucleotidyl transferase domain-containing protein n=1 Tax=Streptomyces mutomycini TaxID=284036 RepID=A0ABW0B180_9ACTN|nr:hypothetical protein [Streptomyces mutomycini]